MYFGLIQNLSLLYILFIMEYLPSENVLASQLRAHISL